MNQKLKYKIVENGRCELLLEDGTTLFLSLVPVRMYRVTGEFNPDGSPRYSVDCQIAVNQDSPGELHESAFTVAARQSSTETAGSSADEIREEKIVTHIDAGKAPH